MEWEISWKSEKNHSPWHFDRQKETTKQRIPSTRWNAIIVSSLTVWNVFSESRLYFLLLLSLTINKQILLKSYNCNSFKLKSICWLWTNNYLLYYIFKRCHFEAPFHNFVFKPSQSVRQDHFWYFFYVSNWLKTIRRQTAPPPTINLIFGFNSWLRSFIITSSENF